MRYHFQNAGQSGGCSDCKNPGKNQMSQSCRTRSQISQGKRDLFHLTLLFSDL